jgi:Cellulase (glycosyl hydrolase family 5)
LPASSPYISIHRVAVFRALVVLIALFAICMAAPTASLAAKSHQVQRAAWGNSVAAAATGTTGTTGVVSAMNGLTLFQAPQSQWGPQMAAMEADGVSVVRSDAPWAVVESQPPVNGPVYDFSSLDAWVEALAEHHLTWLPILDDTPWWAKSCVGMCPPEYMPWFSGFAAAVAARYGAGGSFWSANPGVPYFPVTMFEVWNEENGTQFWSTGPSGAQYATMYSDVRTAIDAVDPTAQVIVGGLGTGDAGYFVQDMLTADPGLAGNIDGIALHPYGASAVADEQMIASFRAALDQLGLGSVPIDITEFGWTTGATTQERWRAQQMRQLGIAMASSNCNLQVLAPYTWVNTPGSSNFALTYATRLTASGKAWLSGLRAGGRMATNTLCSTPAPS